MIYICFLLKSTLMCRIVNSRLLPLESVLCIHLETREVPVLVSFMFSITPKRETNSENFHNPSIPWLYHLSSSMSISWKLLFRHLGNFFPSTTASTKCKLQFHDWSFPSRFISTPSRVNSSSEIAFGVDLLCKEQESNNFDLMGQCATLIYLIRKWYDHHGHPDKRGTCPFLEFEKCGLLLEKIAKFFTPSAHSSTLYFSRTIKSGPWSRT